ncbi:MAG: RNHCP domain-containing protein [Patescibacteria group bacterium]|jgi:rubrerythrin
MRKFQRTIEDFACGNCGAKVKGDGYTDHCPVCLWSRHVDVNPGDRVADCRGLMKPMGLELKHGETRIVYKCEKCGYEHRVKKAEEDNYETMLKLAN